MQLRRKNASYLATALSDHISKKSLINPFVVIPWHNEQDSGRDALLNLIEDQNTFLSVDIVRYPKDLEPEQKSQMKLSRLPAPEFEEKNVSNAGTKKNIYGE